MIRKTMILLWMLFPVAVGAYHFNVGPKQEARERAYTRLQEIRRLERVDTPDWEAIIQGYGELMPVACNTSSTGRQVNRRVEIWLRPKRG